MPECVAFDPVGQHATDATATWEGALIPFGGYKGSALGIIVELMARAMLDAKCGLRAGEMRTVVFIAIKGDIFSSLDIVERLAAQLREDETMSPSRG